MLTAGACRAMLCLAPALLVWSLLPAAWGWTPRVIMSDSMRPVISAGDVVVTKDLDVESLRPGQVITVTDPDHAGRTRTHRFVRLDSVGEVVTRGDANAGPDSTHVARQDVRGVAVLRIPYVGRPVVWAAERAWTPLAGLVLLAVLLASGSRIPSPGRPARASSVPSRFGGRRRAMAGVAAGVTVATLAGGPADAAFTRTWVSAPSTLNAADTFYPYRAAVLADDPFLFWRLSETSGTTVQDASGNGRVGTISGAPALGQPAPNDDNLDLALGTGSGTAITQATAQLRPSTFSVEAWVRTTTSAGGRLVGLGNGGGASPSTIVDCQLYVGTTGKVYFGLGSTRTVVGSTSAVNDGAWHHVVGTYKTGNGGAKLYVDGVLQGSAAAKLQSFTGYWRGAAEFLTGWTANPTSPFLAGTVDDVAVYTKVLTPARVSAHYAAASS